MQLNLCAKTKPSEFINLWIELTCIQIRLLSANRHHSFGILVSLCLRESMNVLQSKLRNCLLTLRHLLIQFNSYEDPVRKETTKNDSTKLIQCLINPTRITDTRR